MWQKARSVRAAQKVTGVKRAKPGKADIFFEGNGSFKNKIYKMRFKKGKLVLEKMIQCWRP